MIEIAIAIAVIGFALVAIIGVLPRGLEVQRDNRSETIINQDGTFWIEAIRGGARGMDDLLDYVDDITVSNILSGQVRTFDRTSGIRTGADVIGLLTRQAVTTNDVVTASVHALSGAAAEKDPSANDRDLTFRYLMRVQIHQSTNTTLSFLEATSLVGTNEPLATLYDLNIELAYPLVRNDRTPTRRQAFRSLVSRNVDLDPRSDGETNYFFVP
jgi:hypothetical protein